MSVFFFFSSRRRHTRWNCDWSSDVCSSDLSGKPAVVVIGDVQYLSIEAQLPFWKQPRLVGAQIEAFVGADSQDRWQECGYREAGAVQCFCTETHARPEAIAGEEIDGVALVGQRGGIGRI